MRRIGHRSFLPLAPLLLAACATVPPAAAYHASGYEPGWTLDIAGGRMVYVGDYGEVRIDVRAPVPRPTFNGHRYEAQEGGHSLLVDVTHSTCYGASGAGYADRVMVTADGRTVDGCGGAQVSPPAR